MRWWPRGCTFSFLTLNCTDGCCRTWLLAARIGKVLGSLPRSHADNTNVGGSSGHVRNKIVRLEVVGQGCGTWLLAARFGKVLLSLPRSHADNTNVCGCSGHVQNYIVRLEVVGQGNINRDAANKMLRDGLDLPLQAPWRLRRKHLTKCRLLRKQP